MLRIAVIIGSTRERRFGEVVARWFVRRAERRDDLELDVIDLRDIPLRPVQQTPFECDDPAVHALAARIEAADGFVVVTPEYNHGYPASLKLAIDSVYDGWLAKPVAFVSYGGIGGGLRGRAVASGLRRAARRHAARHRQLPHGARPVRRGWRAAGRRGGGSGGAPAPGPPRVVGERAA